MLAYRHAYHAGNHADVLKHVVLGCVLRHLAAKEKGYRYVDTHAGAGGYARVLATWRDALERYADGIYMIWYPQVTKLEAAELPRRLEALAPKGWLHARLSVQRPDLQGYGLAGSGVFVLNPPHTLHAPL